MQNMPWWAYLLSTALTALISGGGVVAGQIIATRQSAAVTRLQLDAQEREARTLEQSAERIRRGEAYLEFVDRAYGLRLALLQWLYNVNTELETFKTERTKYNLAESRVLLYGSPAVKEAVREVTFSLLSTNNGPSFFAVERGSASFEKELDRASARFWKSTNSLMALARLEISPNSVTLMRRGVTPSVSPSGVDHQGQTDSKSESQEVETDDSKHDGEPGSPAGDCQ